MLRNPLSAVSNLFAPCRNRLAPANGQRQRHDRRLSGVGLLLPPRNEPGNSAAVLFVFAPMPLPQFLLLQPHNPPCPRNPQRARPVGRQVVRHQRPAQQRQQQLQIPRVRRTWAYSPSVTRAADDAPVPARAAQVSRFPIRSTESARLAPFSSFRIPVRRAIRCDPPGFPGRNRHRSSPPRSVTYCTAVTYTLIGLGACLPGCERGLTPGTSGVWARCVYGSDTVW